LVFLQPGGTRQSASPTQPACGHRSPSARPSCLVPRFAGVGLFPFTPEGAAGVEGPAWRARILGPLEQSASRVERVTSSNCPVPQGLPWALPQGVVRAGHVPCSEVQKGRPPFVRLPGFCPENERDGCTVFLPATLRPQVVGRPLVVSPRPARPRPRP